MLRLHCNSDVPIDATLSNSLDVINYRREALYYDIENYHDKFHFFSSKHTATCLICIMAQWKDKTQVKKSSIENHCKTIYRLYERKSFFVPQWHKTPGPLPTKLTKSMKIYMYLSSSNFFCSSLYCAHSLHVKNRLILRLPFSTSPSYSS